MQDFSDNQEPHKQVLYHFQHDSKLQKETVSIINDAISQHVWDGSLHISLMSQYRKKEYPENIHRVLLFVFHRTSNRLSGPDLQIQVF